MASVTRLMETSTMTGNFPLVRLELMQAAESFIFLLQAPLPEPIQEILNFFLETPIVIQVIVGVGGLGTILTYLVTQSEKLSSIAKNISSFLGYVLETKTKSKELICTPVAADLDTRAERAKLLKAFNIKLEKRLTDVLGNDQLIALSYESRPGEVGRYQRQTPPQEANTQSETTFLTRLESLNPLRLWQRPNQPAVELPLNESMLDVFRREHGRLFILGAPGAGKTTTLLELTKELVAVAETDEQAPVPIIFELSNWKDDRQSIDQWLVAQLKEEYNVDLKVSQYWIATHQILPLLDGLDEVGAERLPECVRKLNAFLPEHEPDRQAVVCCRTQEFQMGESKLTGLNGAVELQPLSDEQIQSYLTAMQQPSLWAQTIKPSAELQDLARTPLMLTVMAVALVNRPVQTKSELFEAYIEERFARYESEHNGKLLYNRRATRKYLECLAGQLKAENQTTFLIETMQPSWLNKTFQKWLYQLVSMLIFSLMGSLIVGLTFCLTDGLVYGLVFGVALGIIGGLINGIAIQSKNIECVEVLHFSFSTLKQKAVLKTIINRVNQGGETGIKAGSTIGLIFGIVFIIHEYQLGFLGFILYKTILFIPLISVVIALIMLPIILVVNLISALDINLGKIKKFKIIKSSFLLGLVENKREIILKLISEVVKASLMGLIIGIFLGCLIGLFVFLEGELIKWWISGLIFGFIIGIFLGFINGVIRGLKKSIRIKLKANEGIFASAQNSVLGTGVGFGIVFLLMKGFDLHFQIDTALIFGFFSSIILWSIFNSTGGLACMQHLALRVVLWRSEAIPRDYAAFLKYTSELRLTRQTGGEFRFFHDLLREHFAQTAHPPEISSQGKG